MSDKNRVSKTIALVGNPNVGKSVIFNHLTGDYMTVSNYPGTTVDVSQGMAWISGESYQVVDTPGVNALIPYSEDEKVTRDLLLKDTPDVVVNVLDAKNLQRALMLTLELIEYRIPMVLALNMMDEALDRGISIDMKRLSALLGVPVVSTVAVTGEGLADLKRAVNQACVPSLQVPLTEDIVRSLNVFRGFWKKDFSAHQAVALALLSGDSSVAFGMQDHLSEGVSLQDVWKEAEKTQAEFVRSPRQLIFNARKALAAETLADIMTVQGKMSFSWLGRVGHWTMNPWPGFFIAGIVLYAVYQFVGVFGAGILVDFFEEDVFGEYLIPAARVFFDSFVPWTFLHDMFVGPYGVISMALTYAFALILPIVTTFFMAFGLLEDSGYLPRLSVMLDRAFRLIGLNGRSIIPLMLGLGCSTMGTVTTRILDTKKEKLIVTILLSLSVPCSAQMAVIFGMTAGLSVKLLLGWLLVVVGTTLFVGWLCSRLLPGARSSFLLEIPPIRLPLLKNVYAKMKARLKWYIWEVVPLFVLGTLILFFLDKLRLLDMIEKMAAPVVQTFLGLPGDATQAFLIGFLRRDYGAAGLFQLQKQGALDLHQVMVSLVLISLFMPCIAQLFMVFKERGWKWTAVIVAFVLTFAIGIAGLVNGVLKLFPGIL